MSDQQNTPESSSDFDDDPRAAVTEDGALSPGSTATGSPTEVGEEEVEETDRDRSERHD
ncbi:MAG TPA: hypothetical protein VGC18_01225 [Lacisediminihabitans sp.]|uniref:hypothetical protein n=1 Tax=Lacisediminihabitans sp. TaxID=2787631 RepID=UPI002ED98D04